MMRPRLRPRPDDVRPRPRPRIFFEAEVKESCLLLLQDVY